MLRMLDSNLDVDLLSPDFDIKKHIGNILKDGDYAEQIEKLSLTINTLDRKLHNQLSNNYDELLSQTFVINEMECKFLKVKERINCLKELSNRLKSKIYDPYTTIEALTIQLSNLKNTCDILRHYHRFKALFGKSTELLNGDIKDIAKAALNIKEIEILLSKDERLTNIKDVTQDLQQMQSFKQIIQDRGQNLLVMGIINKNLGQTGNALQIFQQFGQLRVVINALFDKCYLRHFHDKLVACLDMVVDDGEDFKSLTIESQERILSLHLRGLSEGDPKEGESNTDRRRSQNNRSSGSIDGQSANELKGIFWSSWEKFLRDTVYETIIAAAHVQLVISKKKDTFAPNVDEMNTMHLDENGDIDNVFEAFLSRLDTALSEEIMARHCSQKKQYTMLKQICEGEYPRLLKSLQDLRMKLVNSNTISQLSSHLASLAQSDNEMIDMKTLLSTYLSFRSSNAWQKIFHTLPKLDSLFQESVVNAFQKGYLSKSLARLFDPVNVLFSASSATASLAPTPEDIGSLIKVMLNELAVVKFDPNLLCLVGKNITKTIKLLLVKCEQRLDNSNLAFRITTQPNNQQINNAAIASILYYLEGVCDAKIFKNFQDIDMDQLDKQGSEALLSLKGDYNQLIKVELPSLLATSCLDPLFSAVEKTLEDIIVTMQRENFNDPDFSQVGTAKVSSEKELTSVVDDGQLPLVLLPASPYMKEFLDFVKAFKRNVLNPLFGHNFDFNQRGDQRDETSNGESPRTADILCQFKTKVLAPTVLNFVANLSLLRPLNNAGRQKIASDCGHFESALTSILLPGHEIQFYNVTGDETESGDHFLTRSFRDFTQKFVLLTNFPNRPLAEYFTECGWGGSSILSPLEMVVVLHSFTHFDTATDCDLLPMVHGKIGSTIEDFWRGWLKPKVRGLGDVKQCQETSRDIVHLIKTCLDDYAANVFHNQRTTFHPAYPVLMKLIEKYSHD